MNEKGYDWGGFLTVDPTDTQPPLSPSVFGKQLLAVADASSARDLLGIGGLTGNFTDLNFSGSNLSSIATRNFSDLQSKPTTLSGYGITDAQPRYVSRQVLGAPAASISFSGLSQAYHNLRLIFCGQSSGADSDRIVFIRFNGDASAAHYRWKYMSVTTVLDTDGSGSDTKAMCGRITTLDIDAFGGSMFEISLPNYSGGFTKNFVSTSSFHSSAIGDQTPTMIAGEWDTTNAITSLTIFPDADNFVAGTTATLILD